MRADVTPSGHKEGRPLLLALAAILVLLWTLLAIVEITARYIHTPDIPAWQPLSLTGISMAVVIGLLAIWFGAGQDSRVSLTRPLRWFLRSLKWLPLLIITSLVATYGLRHAVFALMGAHYQHIEWPIIIMFETVKVSLFYSLWLGLAFGARTFEMWREQAQRLLGMQKALAEAQLAQLKAQLRPHFLFNTLNTISSLMQVDVGRADRLLARLGDLLRASLSLGERDTVPLATELGFLRLYADIMSERFDGRAVLRWELEEPTPDAEVPAMVLQPLLENAYRYGVEANSDAQVITIRIRLEGEILVIRIHNTGSTLADERLDGIGLGNCRERLQRLYGAVAALTLNDDPEGGVAATMRLPRQASTP